MVTVYFQSIALKYRISNNLSARYEKFLGLANQTMRRKPSMIYFCVRLSSNASRKGLTSCMSRPGQTALRRNLLRDNQKRCREVLHRTDRKRGCVRGSLFRSAVDGESQYDYHLLVHLVEVRGSASRFPANSSKLLLATPETGHARSSGLSSKGVPGGGNPADAVYR